ncbi:MAG: hypothetical protein Q8R55_01450 [Candidatus Taylorbacteria bacterium]|nr:hypothetical protein [Candidatus Taylorbacteria bacterium]
MRTFFISFLVVIGVCFFIFGETHAQTVNEIYGYIKTNDTQKPVEGAEVWYCKSSVPEEFPQCLSALIEYTDGNGRWEFPNPEPNYYYRIWALKPLGAYSQTYAQFYSGGQVAWKDLFLTGVQQTPGIQIISPNKGCVSSDKPINIEWSTAIAGIDHFKIGYSESEFIYESISEVPGNARLYSWTPSIKNAWVRIAVVAQGPQGQFLGQDFSDAQVQLSLTCPITTLQASNIRVANITDTTARVQWETNVSARSTVEYKIGTLSRSDGFATTVTSTFITSHDTPLTYLSPNTTYYFYIREWDAAQNEVRTETVSFKTLASSPIPSPPPTIVPTIVSKEVPVIGVARINGTPIGGALVWGWSNKGKSDSTTAGLDGRFELTFTRDDVWHIGAAKEIAGIPYTHSGFFYIAPDSGRIEIDDLKMVRADREPLVQSVSITKPATEEIVVRPGDGSELRIPSTAVISAGTVTATIKPTIEVPSEREAIVVSTVYDITLKDQSGKIIKDLQKEIEITLPYREVDLRLQGVSEDAIFPSYFDESAKKWIKIASYTHDKVKNVIIVRVTHLTRYAIIAAADITPPSAPIGINIEALEGGKIRLSWTNPARDFVHAKLYRSESSKTLGIVVANEIFGATFTDNKVKDGIVYYYTVRAVDPAGNESSNTKKVNARARGTSSAIVGSAETVQNLTDRAQIQPGEVVSSKEMPIEPEKPQGFFSRIWQNIKSFLIGLTRLSHEAQVL